MLKLCQLHPCPNGTLGLHLSRAPWDPYPWVSGVQEGSSAQRAGVRTGDTVLQLNGRDVLGLRISQIAADIGDHWRSGAACVSVVIWRNRDGGGGTGGRRKQQAKGRQPDGGEEAADQEDPEEEAEEDENGHEEEEEQEEGGDRHAGGVINQQSLQKFATCLQHIAQLLECPVCLEVVRPPGWQCCNGHVLCNTCRGRSVKCPVCRVPLGPRGRCLLADKLFTLLAESFPCDGVRSNSNSNGHTNNSKQHLSTVEQRKTNDANNNSNSNNKLAMMSLVKKRKSDSKHSSSGPGPDLGKSTEDFHNRPKMAATKPKEAAAVGTTTTATTTTTAIMTVSTTTTTTTTTATTPTGLQLKQPRPSPESPRQLQPGPGASAEEAATTTATTTRTTATTMTTTPPHAGRLLTARMCPGEVHQSDELQIPKTQTDNFAPSDSASAAVVVVRVAGPGSAAATTSATATAASLASPSGRKSTEGRASFGVGVGVGDPEELALQRASGPEPGRARRDRERGIEIGMGVGRGVAMRLGLGVGAAAGAGAGLANNVVVRVELKSNEKTRDALMDQGCRGSCSHNNNSSNNHSDNSFPKIPDKEEPLTRARTRPEPEAGAGERARQKSHEIRAEDKVAGAHGPTRWIHEEQLQQRRNEEDELQQQQQDADQHQLAVQQYQNYYCPTGKSCCCYVQSPSRTSRTSPSPRPGAGLRPTGGDGEEGEPETEWTKAGSRGPAASAAMNKCLSTSSVTGGGGGNNNNGGNDEDEEIAPVTSLNTSTTMATTTTTRVTTTRLRAAASGSRGIWSAGKAFVRPSNHGPTDWDLERGAGPAACPWCVLRAPRSEGQLLAHLTQGHGAPVAHYHGAFGARVRVRLMHSKSPVPCLSLAGAGPAEEKFFLARIPLPATTTTPSTPATPPPATPAPSPSPSQSPSTTKTSTTSASTSTSFSPSSAPSPAASISAASPGAPRTSAHPSACAAPLQYAVFLWHLNALPAAAPRRFETIIESGRTGVRWFGLAHPLSTSWPRIRAEGHFLLHSPARRAREVIDVAPAGVGALADDEDEFFDIVIRIK